VGAQRTEHAVDGGSPNRDHTGVADQVDERGHVLAEGARVDHVVRHTRRRDNARMPITVLRASWLFDGVGSTLTADPTVVLDGGRITAVGQALPTPDGATVVDLAGATLLPGLVDTHVHLAFDASSDPFGHLADRDDAAALDAMAAAARTAALGGVTTVRDLGDRGYLALALRDTADTSLPTIVASGPPVTTPGGHCHFLGGEADGVAGIREVIDAHAERGVDVIKIMASGGNLTPGSRFDLSQFDVDELRAAVERAHRHGLPITAHAHGPQAVADAVAAGVDGIEHVSFMTADGVDTPSDGLVRTIVEERIALSVTLGIFPVPGAGPPPAVASRLPAIWANIGLLCASGAVVTIGTDAGISMVKPHDVLGRAIGQLAGLGPTPAEALRAATSVAADVCGLGQRKGRLAPGFDADVLAVDGDPLADPAALHQIRAVFVRGQRIR
jgi:imidazolonepropionase-like amidohydrolase